MVETAMELARSLDRISQKKLKHDIVRHWFQGSEPYFDFFANTLHDELTWFQFTFRGKSICWNKLDPIVRTGVTTDLAMNDVAFYSASKTVQLDIEINEEFFRFAREILSYRKSEGLFAAALHVLADVDITPHS
ncbi:MAG: hypothetical protein K8S54_00775 [Spirochaetia bacterium]|nr:hypothetical protein [Spirochaetia bacterium]